MCGDGSMNGKHLLTCSKLKDIDDADNSPFGFSYLYWTTKEHTVKWPRLGAIKKKKYN